MSNPFRRQPVTLATADEPQQSNSGPSQASAPSADITTATTPSTKVKRVRITSPPRSPPPGLHSATEAEPLQERANTSYHSGSQLPEDDSESSSSDDAGPNDPFARDQSSDDESPVEQISRQPIATGHNRTASGAPLNPFNKTLATLEGGTEAQNQQEQDHSSTADLQAARSASKQAMDVDSFKNLLMTGKAKPPGAAAAIQSKVLTNLQGDSSSSTDTSSLSRQSLFETLQEPHGETPRTSYELSVSEDDDNAKLIAKGGKLEKKKPPPPKPRHGKAVTPKGPQTVAFDDFSPTFISERTSTFPITITSPTSPKSLSRTPTDLNKPLPPPPPRTSSDDQRPPPSDPKSPTSASSQPTPASPKKAAPAPPLARRSSQLRSTSASALTRPRSNTAASSSSQPDASPAAASITESTTSPQVRAAPPPAPSTAESTASPQIRSALPQSKSAPPPPPPTRRSRAGTGPAPADAAPPADGRAPLARTPSHRSQASHHSLHAGGAAAAAPPPPPRPRRGSARGSVDFAREEEMLGGEGAREGAERPGAERRRSGNGNGYGPMLEEREALGRDGEGEKGEGLAAPRADVLADMEAFRREVDELRERYRQGRGEPLL